MHARQHGASKPPERDHQQNNINPLLNLHVPPWHLYRCVKAARARQTDRSLFKMHRSPTLRWLNEKVIVTSGQNKSDSAASGQVEEAKVMMLKTHLPQSRSETNFGGRGQPECDRFLACEGLGRSQIWSFSHVALLLVQQVWDSHIYDASNPNVGSRGLEQEFVHLQRQNYSTNTTQSFGFGMQSWCQRLSKGYFVAWYFSPLCDSQIGKQVSGIFFLKDIILLSTAYPSF